MSSRALRKAQKEQEELELIAKAAKTSGADEEPDESPVKDRPSAFAFLGEDNGETDEDDEEQQDSDQDDLVTNTNTPKPNPPVSNENTPRSEPIAKKKGKKKKNRGKKNPENQNLIKLSDPKAGLDDIDKALKSLSIEKGKALKSLGDARAASELEEVNDMTEEEQRNLKEICNILAIDTHHLRVAHETRRLFGKAAFSVDQQDQAQRRANRRVDAQGDSVGLVDAVSGRNAQAGPGLQAIVRRRNPFIEGKEDWPRAPGGGLSMEVVEKRNGVTEYRFIHHQEYQAMQHEFDTCIQSLDPTFLVNLLRFNPYHISTLLQVSEIARNEKDWTTTGDLLERALFSFGRALHHSFISDLEHGKARLDFRRPENREFWLAGWRYIQNISMRGTWRTVYEWAKLLLSLDPENDPFEMKLIIDQLAIRAKQYDNFLELTSSHFISEWWEERPNLAYSTILARKMRDRSYGSQHLRGVIVRYPWVAAKLLIDLNIDRVPPSVWGKSPPSDVETLHSEYYVTGALDLWKSPDAIPLLKAAAEDVIIKPNLDFTQSGYLDRYATLSEARHILLTEKPALISLIPQALTSQMDSTFDPLPPPNSISSYGPLGASIVDLINPTEGEGSPVELLQNAPRSFVREINQLQNLINILLPGIIPQSADEFDLPPWLDEGQGEMVPPVDLRSEAVQEAMEAANSNIPQLHAMVDRLLNLLMVLADQPGGRFESEVGEAVMTRSGYARVTIVQPDSEEEEGGMTMFDDDFGGGGND